MQAVALIHEENGVYGVSFPDFPGATTVANSADEAVAKAGEVLAFHVEGLAEDGDLPQPRSLEQLSKDATFKEDAQGATAILVPYSPPGRAVRVNMTFDEGLLDRVDAAVRSSFGETRSGFFAKAARSFMMRGEDDTGFSGNIDFEDKSPKHHPRKRA